MRRAPLKPLDEGEGLGELRKARLLGFEFPRMNAAAQAPGPHRVFQVQHLVVEQVLDGITRAGRAVEDAAYHDGVVGGVVVAERTPGVVFAPGEIGPAEEPAEEAHIERVEDFLQMEVAALGTKVALAAAGMANEFGLTRDGGRGGEALVPEILRGVDRLAIELGKKNVRNGVEDRFWRALKQIGEAGIDFAIAQANRCVERGKTPEANMHGRHGRARAQGAVLFLEDGDDVEGHQCRE